MQSQASDYYVDARSNPGGSKEIVIKMAPDVSLKASHDPCSLINSLMDLVKL